MLRKLLYTSAAVVLFAGLGHAVPPEYNAAGRDMYGNTVEQNEAIRARGAAEKARLAQDKTREDRAETYERLRSLIPGAVILTVLALAGAVVLRTRR
jgi:hypothetical protein